MKFRIPCLASVLVLTCGSVACCVDMNNYRISTWNSAYETTSKEVVRATVQLAGEQGTYSLPSGLVGQLSAVQYDNRFVDADRKTIAAIHGVWQLQNRKGYFVFREPDQSGLWDGYWGQFNPNGSRGEIRGSWNARIVSVEQKLDVKTAQLEVGEGGLESRREFIQGTNNIMPVTFLQDGLKISNAVGNIAFKKDFVTQFNHAHKDDVIGTCFLVAPELVMTAGHVVPKESSVYAKFEESLCVFAGEPVAASDEWDYALFEVKFERDSANIPRPIRIMNGIGKKGTIEFRVDEPIIMIHFPGGQDKKITLFESKICNADLCRDRLLYTTDTTPGSSGAPVINQFWDVIGIHRGPTEYLTKTGQRVQANYGSRIDKIIEDLRTRLQGSKDGAEILRQLGIPE